MARVEVRAEIAAALVAKADDALWTAIVPRESEQMELRMIRIAREGGADLSSAGCGGCSHCNGYWPIRAGTFKPQPDGSLLAIGYVELPDRPGGY